MVGNAGMDPGHEVFLQHCWILPLRDGEEEKAWSIHTCNMVWVAQEKYPCPKLSVERNSQVHFRFEVISCAQCREAGKGIQFRRFISPVKLRIQTLCCLEPVAVFRRTLSTHFYFLCFLFIQDFRNKPLFSIRVHKAEIKIFMYCCLNNKISLFV